MKLKNWAIKPMKIRKFHLLQSLYTVVQELVEQVSGLTCVFIYIKYLLVIHTYVYVCSNSIEFPVFSSIMLYGRTSLILVYELPMRDLRPVLE